MRRSILIPCLIVLAVASQARPAAAQPHTPPTADRFGVSGSVGVFVPRDSVMSDIYGSFLTPVTAQVDVLVSPDFSVFGGLRWLPASGKTVQVAGPVTNDLLSASLTVRTFRFGALASRRVAPRWTLAGGAGVAIASYTESIAEADLAMSGRSTGVFALVEARYALRAKWSVLGRFEYSTIGADGVDGGPVNIGGPDFQVGVRFTF